MKIQVLLCLFLCCFNLILSASTKRTNQRAVKRRLPAVKSTEMMTINRRERARAPVISCREFKRGTCRQTRKNIISSHTAVKTKIKCQQLCFGTQGCAGFTFHSPGAKTGRRCVLFRDCQGDRGKCKNCISGPIMPRIGECLSARQTIAVTPDDYQDDEAPNSLDNSDEATTEEYTNYDEELYEVDYVDDDEISQITESSPSYTDYDYGLEEYDYDYDYSINDNPTDEALGLPLDEDAINVEEEEEDTDINIEEGFIADNNANTVDILPRLNLRNNLNTTTKTPPIIMFFVLLGGFGTNGSISLIDLLNTGLGNSAQALSIAPLPASVLQGGECSSAYTDRSITSCGRGYRSLSPYGYQYNPGSCYSYGLQSQRWEARGGKMRSFRKGAAVTKLGRYLLASGGTRQKRSLSTVEVFDPAQPEGGWRDIEGMRLPTGVSEHCAVTFKGRKGKEIVVTGGKEKRNRAIKFNLKTKRWYSLNEMNRGRRNHACVKATLNGHPGLIVSGGSGGGNSSLSSVEFYDAKTGTWLNMPRLRKGRSGHVMTITRGKLMVAGGEKRGRKGRQYLDDVEIFTGKRWVKSKQKLDRPRSRFSLVKLPKHKIALLQKKVERG